MKCIVTGGSGFIGSHVVDALRKEGHEVGIVDVRNAHPGDHYFDIDIRDVDRMAEVLSRHGPDALFHIAAIADARRSLDNPIETIDVNVRGTAAILEAARRASVGRVVLASTVWYYNAVSRGSHTGSTRHLDEDEPIAASGGGHVYTTSKISSELLCHDFLGLYGLEFTILRYGIPYGPRMWPGLALYSFLENSFAGRAIRIFGDGSAVRRWVYVEDLASAHTLALSDKARNQTYNLEGDRDVTVRELAEIVARHVEGTEIQYIEEPARRGELKADDILISNEKAKRELGWAPKVELEEGVARAVEWYQGTLREPGR